MNQVIKAAYVNPESIENARLINAADPGGFSVTKICLTNDKQVERWRTYFPDAEIVSNLESIINDKNIQLVLLSAGAEIKKPIVEQVLQSGKHIRIL